MPYSTPDDVRVLVATELTDDQISDLIEASDAEIDKRVGAQSSSDPLVRKLSSLLTARTIRASQPVSSTVGEYREDVDVDAWGREIEDAYRALSSVSMGHSRPPCRRVLRAWRG
jgi:hypothetical protein